MADTGPDDEDMTYDTLTAKTMEDRVIAQLAKFALKLERFQIREHWMEEKIANNQRFNDERHALLLTHLAKLEAGIPSVAMLAGVAMQLTQMYAEFRSLEEKVAAVLSILTPSEGADDGDF